MVNRKENGDQPFEVRLGRMRGSSGQAKVTGFLSKVRRKAHRVAPGKRGYRQTRGQSSGQFQRRVIVKVHVQTMARHGSKVQAQHLDYIRRGSAAREGEEGRLFDRSTEGADADAFEERRRGDRHQFRIIVSPEDGNDLADLKAYTRDLVSAMETDLETKLDWVAADHYDTAQPHVHLIVGGRRGDGQDLVIPKRYIAHGIRGRAQELVDLELGPVLQIDVRRRFAEMVQQERFTALDHELTRNADGEDVDLVKLQDRVKPWRAQLLKKRLQTLEGLGLANPVGKGRWQIAPEAEQTLKRMGARGDILNAMHQALKREGVHRFVTGATAFDPSDQNAKDVTGKIIALGVADDVQDRSFVIVDGVDGRATYIDIGPTQRLGSFDMNQIIKVKPPSLEPRASDGVIDDIARGSGGSYSAALHLKHDPRARPAFVEAHERRLEALRSAGHATRRSDGTWSLPPDYLARAARFEREAALTRPVQIEMLSRLTLKQMVTANGNTWLDAHNKTDLLVATGFGFEVQTALRERIDTLIKRGFLKTHTDRITDDVRKALLQSDLRGASQDVSAELGKPYGAPPQSGAIKGHYLKTIDRPSGRFAVIERAHDFTLVPWRCVMERRLGQSIAGQVHRGQIS